MRELVDNRVRQLAAAASPDAVKGGKENPYTYHNDGLYVSVTISGSYKNQEPMAHDVQITAADGLAVLEAWRVDNLKNNTALTLAAELSALPELSEGESLAFYSVTGEDLTEPVKADLAEKDTVTLELSFKGVTGLALVKIAAPEQPQPEDDPDDEQPVDGKVIWANDDICLIGKMPGNAVVDATPVTVEIDGQKVLAAYDIKIYANANQKAKGKTWQPADNKVTVYFRDVEFTECESVDVYHLADEAAEPEFVSAVVPDDHGTVEFEAASFSVYVVVSHEEETVLTPRVQFHFIANGAEELNNGSFAYYAGDPYSFANKHGDQQTLPWRVGPGVMIPGWARSLRRNSMLLLKSCTTRFSASCAVSVPALDWS